MPLNLFDVGYFLHAVDAGSFALGARRAAITPAAMTKAIRRLEDELGAQLLARSARGSSLTHLGQEMLPMMRALHADGDRLRARARGEELPLGGDLRIMAMEVFSPFVLPKALAALIHRHPGVVPRAYEGIPERMNELIAAGRIDVGFTISAARGPSIRTLSLGTSPGVLVCGPGHPLAKQPRGVGPRDLARHPSVVPRFWGAEHLPSLDQFPEERWPRRIGATIELLRMGVALVETGAFLGYFPEVSIRAELAAGSLVRLRAPRAQPFTLSALLPAERARREAEALVAEVRLVLRSGVRGRRRAP